MSIPSVDLAITAAFQLAKAVQDIKVYRRQCRDLGDRCTKLELAFRERCQGLEGSELMATVDEVSHVIDSANRKARIWASWNRIKSIVNQGDIKLGLADIYRDIDMCAQQFNIASSAGLHRGQRELALIHERDNADNREILRSILHILQSGDVLRDVLSDPNAVRPIMQTIQEQLQEESVQPEQSRQLQQGLYEIHKRTKYLPPIVDLTGQIQRTSKRPCAYGAYNDVYTGLWLGEEKVALKFARAINHTEKARNRFYKEVEIWRDLHHPHVCRLYGIYYEEDQIYSVSPWMECGSALDFINSTDKIIDRLGILGDVASGMEYLHGRNVVHGDLRAANILIGDDGSASVSDFGLSRVIEEVAPESLSACTRHGDSAVRWEAPELIQQDHCEGSVSVSPATDVWSFGMLCLEILTGKKPYDNRAREASVVLDLVQRRLPDRPTDAAVVKRGLNADMWDVMLHCWNWESTERPSMATLKTSIRSLRSSASGSPPPILGDPLFDSPKPLSKELPPLNNRSPAIPIPKPISRPPGVGTPFRTPPLVSSPPYLLSNSPPGFAISRHTPSQGSSSSSVSSNVPQPWSSESPSRRTPSSLSVPRQGSQIATRNSSTLGITIGGISPPKSPQSLFHTPTDRTAVAPNTTRENSLPSKHTRTASKAATDSITGSSPPSGLSQANPMYFPHREPPKAPPLKIPSSSSMDSSTKRPSAPPNTSRPQKSTYPLLRGSSSADPASAGPPILNIEPADEDLFFVSESFFGSSSEDVLSSYGTLQSPPLRFSEERSESELSGGEISSSLPSSVDSPFTHGRSSSSISDAVPPPCRLLDFTNLDFVVYVRQNRDGSIKVASLGGLIDHLLKETDGYSKDQKILDIFLATHRLFASTADVLKLLLYRFTNANSDQKMDTEVRVSTRYRILKILGQWLKGHYAKVLELQNLNELRLFLYGITSPNVFLNSAQESIEWIEHLMATHPSRTTSPVLSLVGSTRSVRPSQISPTGLAVALYVLEGMKYQAITVTDCVSYLLHKGDSSAPETSNRVAEARVTNNKIVHWVKKSILRSDKVASREDTLVFFINAAAECHKLHNYSSMSALIAGIESPQIARLKLTRGRLDKAMRDKLKKLSRLFEISHNHRAYRDALPKPGKASCLPYLAIHLKDLQLVYERHPDRIPLSEQSLINFEKFAHVHDSILSLLAYQEDDTNDLNLDGKRKEGPLLYLEGELATVSLGHAAENRLEERSLDLQKQEDRDFEHRVPELAAVGFRMGK